MAAADAAARPAERGAAAQVDNQAYPVTVDALHTVFSPYGFVQKIAIFDKTGTSQARPAAARRLRARLLRTRQAECPRRRRAGAGAVPGPGQRGQCQGRAGGARHLRRRLQQGAPAAAARLLRPAARAGPDGLLPGAQLKLSYSVHRELNVKTNTDRSWDYTAPAHAPAHAPDMHASHDNGMHGYGGHGGHSGSHGGGHGGGHHGGGHGGGHARGHEEPVLVTGASCAAGRAPRPLGRPARC